MGEAMKRLKERLTFANVVSLLALFIALGGTSYAALTLPRNSVGSTQIKARSVGPSELRTQAVSGRSVRNRSLTLRDISASARLALKGEQGTRGTQGERGPAGPSGITYFAAVDSGGGTPRGNSLGASHGGGTNEYAVQFPRQLDQCVATATLATVLGGLVEQPPPGRITVAQSTNIITVKTFAADGSPAEIPFHVIVAC
jgi:hypothetical protein